MRHSFAGFLLCPVLLACVAGCHVSNQKTGKSDNVEIGTPFGSMHVKTNDNVAANEIGIGVYPGAVLQVKDKSGDNDAADVNMSFGSFHLGVKAVSYLSSDAPDKVLTFYKKDLAKYGVVLQCNGDTTVGSPARTEQGLTCSDVRKGVHIGVSSTQGTKTELRTGSKQNQHVVEIEPHDSGTKFGLIALELPGDLHFDDDKKTN